MDSDILQTTDLGRHAGGDRRARHRRGAPPLRGHLPPRLQRGAARVSEGDPERRQPPATAPTGDPPPTRRARREATRARGHERRRAGLRDLRPRLGPRPRGDRARQDRGHREGQQPAAGLGRRRWSPGVFVLLALAMIMHGVAWLLNDLFFEQLLGRLLRRGRVLPADRGGRRALRLPLLQEGRAADARDGDRGGEGDQGRTSTKEEAALMEPTTEHRRSQRPADRQRPLRAAAARHAAPPTRSGRHRPPAPGALALGRRAPDPLGRGHRRQAPDAQAQERAAGRRRRRRLR